MGSRRARPGKRHLRRKRPGSAAVPPPFEAEIEIESLASSGEGVGRLDEGKVVFVRDTAPGDRVRISGRHVNKGFARAEVLSLVEVAASRTTPRCPVFGRCGGCAWQHIDYEEQCRSKEKILVDALTRIGGYPELPAIRIVPSPLRYHYRTRTRLRVSREGIGFHRAQSNRIEAIRNCPVLVPELDRELEVLAERVARGEVDLDADEVEWELAIGDEGGARSLRVDSNSASETARRKESDEVFLRVGPDRVAISEGGFFQANASLRNLLVDRVIESSTASRTESLIELYAGAGFFTLSLAGRFEKVVSVESDRLAVSDLEANLAHAHRVNVEVVRGRVEASLADFANRRPDVLFLDPPRTGLARGAAERLAAVGASRIVYLSCNPASLSRDLAGLRVAGYRLDSVEAFDLFPQTPHVEALAVLERGDSTN